jgi:hypothetical protein
LLVFSFVLLHLSFPLSSLLLCSPDSGKDSDCLGNKCTNGICSPGRSGFGCKYVPFSLSLRPISPSPSRFFFQFQFRLCFQRLCRLFHAFFFHQPMALCSLWLSGQLLHRQRLQLSQSVLFSSFVSMSPSLSSSCLITAPGPVITLNLTFFISEHRYQ